MADASHSQPPVSNDYNEHNRTFDVFTTLVKWGTISTAAILVLMAIFLL